jgi:diaminohydroxyphosphoribosylaminopyrimidine deaminase/5-amino-6-(5-phosphoribosylamino)uracil reductase
VHRWRSEEDSILVATNTALYDNPMLNVRLHEGKNPTRILLDKNLRVPTTHNFYDNTQPTLIYNTIKSSKNQSTEHIQLQNEEFKIEEILNDLYSRKIQSVIIEGGAQLLNNLLQKELWDEIRVFTSNQQFETGIKAPIINQLAHSSESINTDLLTYYYNHQD